jgi:hypothetical protein
MAVLLGVNGCVMRLKKIHLLDYEPFMETL